MSPNVARLASPTEKLHGGGQQNLPHESCAASSNELAGLRFFLVRRNRLEGILAVTTLVLSASFPNFAQSSELGFPGSALAEFQHSQPSIAVARAPTLDAAPMPTTAEHSAKADEKTIKYTGKCFARLDGHVRIDGPCPVTWRTGSDMRVDIDGEDKKARGGAWRAVVSRDGRKWRARWGQLTDRPDHDAEESNSRSVSALKDLGEVRKHGSCWSNSRVRICERES